MLPSFLWILWSGCHNLLFSPSEYSHSYSMKQILIKIFWPVLQFFEKGQGEYNYTSSRRTILLIVGPCMLLMCAALVRVVLATGELAAFVPILVFFAVGLVATAVGILGSDRAVANIWGNK